MIPIPRRVIRPTTLLNFTSTGSVWSKGWFLESITITNPTHKDTKSSHVDEKMAAAEIARIEAERSKLDFESKQIMRGLSRRCYTPRFVIEAVVGGAIAGGLFVVWLNGYLVPRSV